VRNYTIICAESYGGLKRTSSYGEKEKKAFADSLDRIITCTRSR
jgi:hypothetical protein